MASPVKVQQIVVSDKLCKGCYLCIWACPWDVFEVSEERNWRGVKKPVAARIEQCRACRLCEWYCPDFALQIIVNEKEEEEVREVEKKYERPWFDRLRKRDEIVSKGVWWLED